MLTKPIVCYSVTLQLTPSALVSLFPIVYIDALSLSLFTVPLLTTWHLLSLLASASPPSSAVTLPNLSLASPPAHIERVISYRSNQWSPLAR